MRVSLAPLMCLTFLVEYLLILGTNRMSGCTTQPLRAAAAAFLGTVYAAACLMPDLRFLGTLFWRSAALMVLGAAAFGWGKKGVLRWGILAMLQLALEGVAFLAAQEGLRGLLPALAMVWVLGTAALVNPPAGEDCVPLELRRNGKTLHLTALRDTGNTLRDPVTGEQVLVISPEAAQQLTGLTREQLRSPLETMVSHPLPGLRLVPYRTVGNSGLLLAMKCPVNVGGKQKNALVAFAAEGFGRGSTVQALTGGRL